MSSNFYITADRAIQDHLFAADPHVAGDGPINFNRTGGKHCGSVDCCVFAQMNREAGCVKVGPDRAAHIDVGAGDELIVFGHPIEFCCTCGQKNCVTIMPHGQNAAPRQKRLSWRLRSR